MKSLARVGQLACSLMIPCAVWAADWPQFQGLHRDGKSEEKGLMKSWPAGGAKVLWSVPVGSGFGGVAVRSGKVYLLDCIEGKRDNLRCFDLETGAEDWSFGYDAPGELQYPGSRSHPCVDDERVYTVGPHGHMHCVSQKTHQPLWSLNIVEAYSGKVPTWGISQCPLLYEDTVIVIPNGKDAGVVAFNKKTGVEAWRSEALQEGSMGSYGSPMLTSIGGVDQVLVVTAKETVGVEAKTGRMLWRTQDWQCDIPIASPVAIGDGRIFVTGGYNAGAAMFKVEKSGEAFSCKTLYKTMSCNCQIHQPLLLDGHFYMNGNDKAYRNGLVCMDLDGNVKWKTEKSPGFEWGGLLLADKRIYVIDGIKGDLCMVDPSPSGYREVARMPLLEGKEMWGTIALSDGKLLCRDQTQLKCVDVKGN